MLMLRGLLQAARSEACWKEATIPPSTKATSPTQRRVERRVSGGIEEEDLVDSMRALDIAHFAEVSTFL